MYIVSGKGPIPVLLIHPAKIWSCHVTVSRDFLSKPLHSMFSLGNKIGLHIPFDIEQFIQEKDSTVEDANESYNHGVANTRDKMDSEGHDGDSLDEEPDGPARQRYLTIYI